MLTIWALEDENKTQLNNMGTLAPLEGVSAKCIRFQKKITSHIGSFVKTILSPCYSRKALQQYAAGHPQWIFDAAHCPGAVCACPSKKAEAIGYVIRQSSVYRLALPVYNPNSFSPLFYTVAGYIATADSHLLVLKRRIAFWVWLLLGAAAVFGLSYVYFMYGITGAMSHVYLWRDTVIEAFKALFV